jgi:acetyl-CoA synthetase
MGRLDDVINVSGHRMGTAEVESALVSHEKVAEATVVGFPHDTPDRIQFTDGLPKTRSGKIMRRILKKVAVGDVDNLGDTSTLAAPTVVDSLMQGRN